MAYLLDADILIQAKDENYPFDICPGFWGWLAQANAATKVFSVAAVRQELEAGADELAEWARRQGDGFFVPVDERTAGAMAAVSGWVQAGDFLEDAKRRFLAGADPWLIAHALAHGHTVVTRETHIEGERRKVKIPTVCTALNVKCARMLDMLRQEKVRFVLEA